MIETMDSAEPGCNLRAFTLERGYWPARARTSARDGSGEHAGWLENQDLRLRENDARESRLPASL
jgi:hypothetical protein